MQILSCGRLKVEKIEAGLRCEDATVEGYGDRGEETCRNRRRKLDVDYRVSEVKQLTRLILEMNFERSVSEV
jgi:hypothetical protein